MLHRQHLQGQSAAKEQLGLWELRLEAQLGLYWTKEIVSGRKSCPTRMINRLGLVKERGFEKCNTLKIQLLY